MVEYWFVTIPCLLFVLALEFWIWTIGGSTSCWLDLLRLVSLERERARDIERERLSTQLVRLVVPTRMIDVVQLVGVARMHKKIRKALVEFV